MQTLSYASHALPINLNPDDRILEISSGLLAPSPVISSKYFYDLRGSLLFEAITRLDEYYLTRTERRILDAIHADLARLAGLGANLIDLGAGNCLKAESLFGSLKPSRYVAVDIASDFLSGVLARLRKSHPEIEIDQMNMDFSEGLKTLSPRLQGPNVFFYPGSSIGNFTPDQAQSFLKSIGDAATQGDALLIGIDLIKEKTILEAAYNDTGGITRLFNLNILEHINRIALADFDIRYWEHRAFYNEEAMRIEMHLSSSRDQVVHWIGGERYFSRGDSILTEYSHKYSVSKFERVLENAGFQPIKHWTDDQHWFGLVLAKVQ